VYDQAISDLKTAKAKLPEDNSFYASKYAASAILARLYLQQIDYTKAVAEADTVIRLGIYSLNAKYSDEFPYPGKSSHKGSHVDNTSEDIFAVQVTEQPDAVNILNSFNEFYASSLDAGRGDIHIDSRTDKAAEFPASFLPEGMTLEQWEDEMIREALRRAHGNKSQAARMLGLSRNALRYRLSKIGIGDESEKDEPE